MNIGHYANNLGAPGGISQYVRRLGAAQQGAGERVTYFSSVSPSRDSSLVACTTVADDASLFAAARAERLDILHVHDPISVVDDTMPVIRTMHGNQGSCPGGGRFLAHSEAPCLRTFNPVGCAWHRLTEHCGSRRPGSFFADLQRTHHEMENVASISTLTVSRFLRTQMEKSGADVSRTHVLLSPAPETGERPFAPPPATGIPRFLFLGRLVTQKGLDWLLRAVATVDCSIHLDVAGDGNLEQYVSQAHELGVADHVTFHGWLGQEKLSTLMARARAVVVPSMWAEPAGLVTLEAAAHGRAVIASRTGGIPEYTDPAFARLVTPGAVDDLAAQLRLMASDVSVATDMGQAGRSYVRRHHRMSQFLCGVTRHYQEAISATGCSPQAEAPTPFAFS